MSHGGGRQRPSHRANRHFRRKKPDDPMSDMTYPAAWRSDQDSDGRRVMTDVSHWLRAVFIL